MIFLSCKEEVSKKEFKFDFDINNTKVDATPLNYVGLPEIKNENEVLHINKNIPIEISLSGQTVVGRLALKVNDVSQPKIINKDFEINYIWRQGLNKISICEQEKCLSRYINYDVKTIVEKEPLMTSTTDPEKEGEIEDDAYENPQITPAPISKDADKDGILDNLDKCPNLPGPKSNDGCPNPIPQDSDGDGIPDSIDECPKKFGESSNSGCPVSIKKDTDGDGISDEIDKCPTDKGPRSNNGCPTPTDTDKDGIPDKQDNCPNVKGNAKHNGCPPPIPQDSDSDGIPDNKDKCPRESGPASNNGCPPVVKDADKDGIPDNRDNCPSVKGEAKHNGCPPPDKDGDGIPDDNDKCPDEKGDGASDGCPEKKPVRLSNKGNLKIVLSDDCASASTDFIKGPFSINLNVKQRIQLRSISVVSNSNWSANLKLSSSGTQIGSANGESIVDGLTEINLTQLNRYLEPGNYTLTVSGIGQLSNLSTCKSETQSSHVSVMNNNHFFNLDYKY